MSAVTGQILLFFLALVVSLLFTFPLVWVLRFFHLTQSIREEGPQNHRAKAGTLTMGGIGFILAIFILSLIFVDFEFAYKYLALLFLMSGYAVIGLTDDALKILQRRNLGLTFWQKLLPQIMLAALFMYYLTAYGRFNTSLWYFLFTTFVIVGSANAANLTDGLNGLLAGTAGIAFLAFAFLAAKLGMVEATTFAVIAGGAILSFLYFNFPRARVFMGDAGALAIGATLAGFSIIIHQEIMLAVIGGVLVIETLSVIVQVVSYKLFRKRVFRMTPLHHHFELLGYSEGRIVLIFWLAALVCGVIGILI